MSVVANAREMRYDCPYCKKEKGCCSLFFWAVRMTAEDYEALVQLGWCRCGRMVYLPINEKCCCPQHSMRIDARRFRANKQQKRVRKRIDRLQRGEWRPKISVEASADFDKKTGKTTSQGGQTSAPATFAPSAPPNTSKGIGCVNISDQSAARGFTGAALSRPIESFPSQANAAREAVFANASQVRGPIVDKHGVCCVEGGKRGGLEVGETRLGNLSDADCLQHKLNCLLRVVLDDLKLFPSKTPKFKKTKPKANMIRSLNCQFSTNAAFLSASYLLKTKTQTQTHIQTQSNTTLQRIQTQSTSPSLTQTPKPALRSPGFKPMAFGPKTKRKRPKIDNQLLLKLGKSIAKGLQERLRVCGDFKEVGGDIEIKAEGRGYVNVYAPWLAKSVNSEVEAMSEEEKRPDPPQPQLFITTQVEKAQFSPEIFNLYAKYQVTIHKDPIERITHQEFKAFLVDTPILPQASPTVWGNIWPHGLGSAFRMYRMLEGKSARQPRPGQLAESQAMLTHTLSHTHQGAEKGTLIGFAVLDVLPSCFYSSYFVWHPDAHRLSLGVVSALEEIDIVQRLAETSKDRNELYYIGYYVHNNNQMRYKQQYQPAELFCPHLKKWVPFDETTVKVLSENPHGSLRPLSLGHRSSSQPEPVVPSCNPALISASGGVPQPLVVEGKGASRGLGGEEKREDEDQLDNVMLLWKHTIVQYKEVKIDLNETHPTLKSELQVYARMVGPILAARMMYVVT
ncbi:hypothetical protein AAMO2058_001134400 [Amorphochlora amoebiformis]